MPELEYHPFEPYLPKDARILVMGTFPPKRERWSMEFYYPNRINDFWRIMGLIFCGDKNYLYNEKERTFHLHLIKSLLDEKGIALYDTGYAVKRLKNNASDKFLEIVEPVSLIKLLEQIPLCHALATTGEKAADTLASITGTEVPKIGACINTVLSNGRVTEIYRMPSTSRAYPLPLEKKAAFYNNMFRAVGIKR